MNNKISKQMLILTMILLCLFVFRNVIVNIPILAQEDEVVITGIWEGTEVTIPVELNQADRIIGDISIAQDSMHVRILSPSGEVLVETRSETPIHFDYTAEVSGTFFLNIVRVFSLGNPAYNITYTIYPAGSNQPPLITTTPPPSMTTPPPSTTTPPPSTTTPPPSTTTPPPSTTTPPPSTTTPPPSTTTPPPSTTTPPPSEMPRTDDSTSPPIWIWLTISIIVIGIFIASAFVVVRFNSRRKKHHKVDNKVEEKVSHKEIIDKDLSEKCNRCGGEGRIKMPNTYIQTSEGVSERYEDCPVCNGNGWV